MAAIDRRRKSSLTAASVIPTQTSRRASPRIWWRPPSAAGPQRPGRGRGASAARSSARASARRSPINSSTSLWPRHCQRTCRAAVGLRRCVARPWCWPCSRSGRRPDRSWRRCRQPALADAALGDCVPSLRALPLEEACELRIRPGRWRSLASGKESVAKRSLACLAAMLQLGVLGGFPQVAREAADVSGGGRVRVAGENTMLRDAQLRSFAPGARVLVIRQHVRKLAPAGSGGPLGPGSVDVGRVVIGTGSPRVAGHLGVGDRPVSRRGAGDRVCCVPEVSRDWLTQHRPVRGRFALGGTALRGLVRRGIAGLPGCPRRLLSGSVSIRPVPLSGYALLAPPTSTTSPREMRADAPLGRHLDWRALQAAGDGNEMRVGAQAGAAGAERTAVAVTVCRLPRRR